MSSPKKLLSDADRPERFDQPNGYDYQLESRKLLALATSLNDQLGNVAKIEMGAYCQDCSFTGEIELLVGNAKGTWRVSIRASRFGKLLGIFDENSALKKSEMRAIVKIAQKLGYEFVSERDLNEPYPGDYFRTWRHRFFDYA